MSDEIKRVVFRVPAVAILAALLLAACATPIAVTLHYGWLLYLIPLAIIVFIMRTRTTVDTDGMVARTFVGRTVVPWSALRSLRVREKSWVRAVLDDGREVTLPAVRTGSIPLLSQVSGGIVPDPSAPVDPEPADDELADSAESAENAENAE